MILQTENSADVESIHMHAWFLINTDMWYVSVSGRLVPALSKRNQVLSVAQCVCKHYMSEGPAEWLLSADCKFQTRLLSISKLLLSPGRPQCRPSQRRRSETQHIKWDVTCATRLFYLYWMGRHWGRNAKKRPPAAWWGLVALQVHRGGSVIFTLTSEGIKETSLPPAHLPPKAKRNCR